MIMMSAINAERGLLTSQNSPITKPRAVYSIDQILGNHHRRNTIAGKILDCFLKLRRTNSIDAKFPLNFP